MKVERAGDLVFWTYYMIDWEKVQQTPSDQTCSECGNLMNKAEQAVDPKGQRFDCYVCHTNKQVIWVKVG
jgi:ribosomal protein S27AE